MEFTKNPLFSVSLLSLVIFWCIKSKGAPPSPDLSCFWIWPIKILFFPFFKIYVIIFPMDKEKLKEIGGLLLKGMKEKEACLLTDIPWVTYIKLKENDEVIRNFIEKKLIEFKKIHLEVIQSTKSEKNSMYLLEKLRPDEFGSKSKNEGPQINIISAIIKQINNDPSNNIISFNRGTKTSKENEDHPVIHEGATLLN